MSWRAVSPCVWHKKAIWQFSSRDRGLRFAALVVLWLVSAALPCIHLAVAEDVIIFEAAEFADILDAAEDAEDAGIFVMKIDGSEERKVAEVEGFARHASPRWSHDGRQLAFEASEGPNDAANFYIVNVDGTQLQELGEHGSPDWSSDDQQLVFHSLGGNLKTGIWVQHLDGTGLNWLVQGSWPRWSADGDKIAYSDGQTVRVLDLIENEDRLLVDVAFAQRPTAFEWSHDGKRLAFFARTNADSPRELFIASAEGMNTELKPRLTGEGMFGGHVTWSADDKQLAFTIGSFIHVVEVEGTGKPQRLPGQPQKSRDPAWSPDGQWIAFARRPR